MTAPQTILQHKKPESLPVVSDGIPGELKTYHTWVLWKLARVGDDWTKHPYGVGTGRRASSTDSRTWSSYEEVLAAYEAGGYDGIGFVTPTGVPGLLAVPPGGALRKLYTVLYGKGNHRLP